jgi:hypothetical protein
MAGHFVCGYQFEGSIAGNVAMELLGHVNDGVKCICIITTMMVLSLMSL